MSFLAILLHRCTDEELDGVVVDQMAEEKVEPMPGVKDVDAVDEVGVLIVRDIRTVGHSEVDGNTVLRVHAIRGHDRRHEGEGASNRVETDSGNGRGKTSVCVDVGRRVMCKADVLLDILRPGIDADFG